MLTEKSTIFFNEKKNKPEMFSHPSKALIQPKSRLTFDIFIALVEAIFLNAYPWPVLTKAVSSMQCSSLLFCLQFYHNWTTREVIKKDFLH